MFPVHVTQERSEIVDSVPKGAITYYLGTPPETVVPSWKRGPWLVVIMSTNTDLATIPRHLDAGHLYYRVFPCGASVFGAWYYPSGYVVDVPSTERQVLAHAHGRNLYKVYIPVDLAAEIPEQLSPEERARATQDFRDHGLCLALAAANMAGLGIQSNTMKLEVTLQDDPLRITGVVQGSLSTNCSQPHNDRVNLPVDPPSIK